MQAANLDAYPQQFDMGRMYRHELADSGDVCAWRLAESVGIDMG